MPVCLYPSHSIHGRSECAKLLCDKPSANCQERSSRCIDIGLINNMADGALEATERQFLSLLASASDGFLIRVSLYALPGVPRSEAGSRYIRNSYLSTEDMWNTHLDGLITTGREPLARNLVDEPYWDSLTKVLGWARENTHSSVWSCLAAHAALLHIDGIGRVRSPEKHCGVFECTQLADHHLTAGAPSRFRLPHSRWNGIVEETLTSSGYTVLTRASGAGVDMFVKHDKSMYVFFQGHPEYESRTLLSEYRRDVGRFLKKETDIYPSVPQEYFDEGTVKALTYLREEAMTYRREELLVKVLAALENTQIDNTWQATATNVYRNWLEYIWAQKEQRLKSRQRSVKMNEIPGLTMPALVNAADISLSCSTSKV